MREMLRRSSPRAYVFLILNAIIALGLAREVWQGTETNSLLAIAPRRELELPNPPAEKLPGTPLDSIQQHALFHTTRRFFVAIDPHALPATPPRPDYELVGTLIIPRKPAIALLKGHAASASRKVKPGDDLDGWMVEAVERGRVVVRYQDNLVEIARSRTPSGQAAIGALRVTPLARAPARLSMSGERRTLGNGGSSNNPPTASESDGQPRVYRPPP